MELVLCASGLNRHAPEIAKQLPSGVQLSTVQCWDRCELCERALLVRLNGGMARFKTQQELLQAIQALQESP